MQLSGNILFIVVCLLQTYRIIIASSLDCEQACKIKRLCYVGPQTNQTAANQSSTTCNCTNCGPVPTCPKCLNGAACYPRGDGVICECQPGFTGQSCQQCVDFPCRNHGICSKNGTKSQCQCIPGYHGKNCEKSDCDDFCLNGGMCRLKPTGPTYAQRRTCDCPPLYSGPQCEWSLCLQENPPSNCSTVNPCGCLNNGTCETRSGNQVCKCTSVWGGEKCNTYLGHDNSCMGRCQNNGICQIKGPSHLPTCICNDGWTGDHCEKPADCQFYCQNGGVCYVSDGLPKCHCSPIHKGPRCQELEENYISAAASNAGTVLPALLAFGISILIICVLGAIYYIYRRRKAFFHSRLIENDFNNPMFQERDSDEPFALGGARAAVARLAYKD